MVGLSKHNDKVVFILSTDSRWRCAIFFAEKKFAKLGATSGSDSHFRSMILLSSARSVKHSR